MPFYVIHRHDDVYRVECRLRSVLELRRDVENKLHFGLKDLLKNSCFVGCVTPRLALIQHDTKLYLCDTGKLRYCTLI